VTPDELRVEAALLERCSGWSCPWPIDTALDLSEYASAIIDPPPDDLTVGEVRQIKELIKRLRPLVMPPEQLAREAKKARRKKRQLSRSGDQDPSDPKSILESIFALDVTQEKLQRWQSAGARARAKNSKRNRIISHWQKLSCPLHARASVVADRLDVSSHYVRRVIREAKLYPEKNGPIRVRSFRFSCDTTMPAHFLR
jgi:hypothetical protein